MITAKLDPSSRKAIQSLVVGGRGVKTAIRRGAYISGKEMTTFLRKEMSKRGRSGRRYLIYKGLNGAQLKKPRLHIASSTSEFPAVITGFYRKSIDFEVQGYKSLIFGSGRDGLAKKYARSLEDSRRPVQRTHDLFKFKIKQNLINEINKTLKI